MAASNYLLDRSCLAHGQARKDQAVYCFPCTEPHPSTASYISCLVFAPTSQGCSLKPLPFLSCQFKEAHTVKDMSSCKHLFTLQAVRQLKEMECCSHSSLHALLVKQDLPWISVSQLETNECETNEHNCDSKAVCSNTPAGSYSCECEKGYVGNGTVNNCKGSAQ